MAAAEDREINKFVPSVKNAQVYSGRRDQLCFGKIIKHIAPFLITDDRLKGIVDGVTPLPPFPHRSQPLVVGRYRECNVHVFVALR